MNTKTFHAASVQDAIRQARRELGADAMLLSSKRVPGHKGHPDRFAVSFAYTAPEGGAIPVETPLDAAVARPRETRPARGEARQESPYRLAHRVHQGVETEMAAESGRAAQAAPATGAANESMARSESEASSDERNGLRRQPDAGFDQRDAGTGGRLSRDAADPAANDVFATESFDKLREQMLSIRKEMLQLAGSVRRVSSASYRQELPNDTLRYLYDLLVEQDFHADLIERILSTMSATIGQAETESAGAAKGPRTSRKREAARARPTHPETSSARLVLALQDAIASYIDLTPEPSLRRKRTSPLVISLVGPPGAGKTTTLVKLAVRYGEASRFPLQIISMDNFRVGASEQLRAYAAVLGVGFDTLTTVPALEKAIREYSSKEIILVDTPGLGWRDFDAAEELSAFLRGLDNSITHMVAPASMKPADFERLADLYEAFDYRSLIFTKLDETTSIGQLVSESWRRQKPLSYFTTGQRIPDDLELASRERICERILPADALAANFAA
ncbi:MAG: hypothetical protein U5J83_11005 [Bryobacterales bacterium]|nr:hypothetical protein [Bryobacterales bacterium]